MTSDLETALFEHTQQPTWIFDTASLAILRVNRAALQRYGYSREEMLAMTLRDLRVPEDVPRLQYTIDEFLEGPGWVRRVTRHRAKSGELFDVEIEVAAVEYEGRRCAVARVTDLTGRDKDELRFRLLVEMSRDGLAIYSADNRLLYISPGGARILGVEPGEITGEAAFARTHPDDRAGLAPNAPGHTGTYTVRIRHADGSWRWIESTVTNLTHDPAVRGHVSVFRDITLRKEAEDALRRSEANFRTVIERSPAMTLVHAAGVVLYANPSLAKRLGFDDPREVVGEYALDRVHPDDRALALEQIARTERGVSSRIELRLLPKHGGELVVESEGVRLTFDGKPAHVVFCTDITERRELYARMAVADRMVSVGTLAAGVAHEINNPLAYVIGNLELLARELPAVLAGTSRLPAPELHAIVADARDGAVRVAAIVRELRALSRSDDQPSKGPVEIPPVLASCLKMVGNELRHRARVFTSVPAGLPAVDANASRLGQVFLNLLVNAAHAIPEGRVEASAIRVRARAEASTVIVEIEDTGVGIPPHVLGRIFDPFFTTKPIGQGTGLGLPISHEIVRSLGGRIEVESTPGVGTTFRVVLPASQRAPATPERGPATPAAARRARVLVVDDEPAVGRSIQALLAPEVEVTHVTRGADALGKVAAGERYDAVLCDLMMPEMSGIELFCELQRRAPALAGRVVFLTGGAFTDQARDFLAGAQHPPLEKPFTEAALRAAIERATGVTSPADPASAG